jgi:hypothetical protein
MAENLHQYLMNTSEPPLIYNNRTMSAGETLKFRGVIPATEFIDLVKRCDIGP